jgi:hypothetical protein
MLSCEGLAGVGVSDYGMCLEHHRETVMSGCWLGLKYIV